MSDIANAVTLHNYHLKLLNAMTGHVRAAVCLMSITASWRIIYYTWLDWNKAT